MVVNTSTFISDIVLFLRNYLRSNITDPISRGSGGSSFIMTSYPKRGGVQYPLITIKGTGFNTKKLGISSGVNWIDCKIEVRTWSRNAKESDDLTQKVIVALKDAQFSASGTNNEQIFGFKLISLNPIVEGEGEQNIIHSKIMTFNYSAILT